MTVVICGSGPSLSRADFTDRSKQYWAVGTLYEALKDRIDTYFCMHTNESILFEGEVITQYNYPLREIIEKYNSRYFTNSISYMIAYALYKGVDSIELIGVDLDADGEYTFERPSIAYWLARAEGEGIEVHWDKLNPLFLYGYESDTVQKISNLLSEKKQLATKELNATENEAAKNQWRGFIYALELIGREIKD